MFPKYFVLQQLLEKHKNHQSLDNYYIISVQHLLRSTGSLFETLIRYGFTPKNIFLTGKIYSTHPETAAKLKKLGINVFDSTIPDRLGYYSTFLDKDVKRMWKELGKVLTPDAKIIVLDDGGFVLKNVPNSVLSLYSVFGIEQTTSGIRLQKSFKNFPVIHVAASAAKLIIEPPIVSEAVKIQLGRTIKDLKPKSIGIIGYGHIGKAIANDFQKKYNILVYDSKNAKKVRNSNNIIHCKSKDELYRHSDIIIGATGHDISELKWLIESHGNKTLISVSSGDIEFNKLLRNCTPYLTEKLESPLQDLKIRTKNGYLIHILRGGLVANFTGKPDSSPGRVIQMTRGLLFAAIVQIIVQNNRLKNYIGPIMLYHSFQSEVINYWFNDQPKRSHDYSREIVKGFGDPNWIESKSKG